MIERVRPKVEQSRARVGQFHDVGILDSASFGYRGHSEALLERLVMEGVCSGSGEDSERLIVREMKELGLV